jgi:hypothetical protein
MHAKYADIRNWLEPVPLASAEVSRKRVQPRVR